MDYLTLSILFFLGASSLLYIILGGADLGAGILEYFVPHQKLTLDERTEIESTISKAMAPVWEANHVWLILIVVILFVGFPQIYTHVSISLFIPLTALIIGLVVRGCAFTFRYYDTLDQKYFRAFGFLFRLGSLFTAFSVGILASALFLGKIQGNESIYQNASEMSLFDSFIAPWWNAYCWSVGLFCVCLFAFLAASFLIGETRLLRAKEFFSNMAFYFGIAMMVTGGLVFVSAETENYFLMERFASHPLSISCMVLATLSWFPYWTLVKKELQSAKDFTFSANQSFALRFLGALIVSFVFLGWCFVEFPTALRTVSSTGGITYTYFDLKAPEATQWSLLSALILGSLVIFPSLFYLFRVFKWKDLPRTSR